MKMWQAIAKHCYFVGMSFDAYEFGKAVGIAIPKDEWEAYALQVRQKQPPNFSVNDYWSLMSNVWPKLAAIAT